MAQYSIILRGRNSKRSSSQSHFKERNNIISRRSVLIRRSNPVPPDQPSLYETHVFLKYGYRGRPCRTHRVNASGTLYAPHQNMWSDVKKTKYETRPNSSPRNRDTFWTLVSEIWDDMRR